MKERKRVKIAECISHHLLIKEGKSCVSVEEWIYHHLLMKEGKVEFKLRKAYVIICS